MGTYRWDQRYTPRTAEFWPALWPMRWSGRRHGHEWVEILWCVAGSVRHELDGVAEDLGPGDLRIVLPGQEHLLVPAGEDTILHMVACDEWVWSQALIGRHAPRGGRLPFAVAQSLPSILPELCKRPGEPSVVAVRLLLASVREAPPQDVEPAWLTAALAEFQRRRLHAQGIAGLVRLVGVSREHLSRTVMRWRGEPVRSVVRRLQVERAEALEREGLSTASAARAAGISTSTLQRWRAGRAR